MVSFVSIIQLHNGRASYNVKEERHGYTAYLINSTTDDALPGLVNISKPIGNYRQVDDPLMNKLLQAIRCNGSNLYDIA